MHKLVIHLEHVFLLRSGFFRRLFIFWRLTDASLYAEESEKALEVAVTEIFRQWGTVFVKIRRDPQGMPYAFVQYTASSRILPARESC